MKYYLGIDGGGTKTKFVLADEELNIVSEYAGPTCHYLQCGLNGLKDVISDGILAICRNLDGFDRSMITSAFIGCAGYGDTEAAKAPIESAVRSAMGYIPFGIGNDCENALAGALNGADGINIIAGTGSVGCGRRTLENGDTLIKRCGGWHHALGSDEGSAYWIAWNLIKAFTRQSDGRDERTLLHDKMMERLEITDSSEIINRIVEEWELNRTKIASLCPLCGELYDIGDPVAMKIISDAADELCDIAIALYKELGYSKRGPEDLVLVSGTGGVFKMGEKITQPMSETLSQHGMKFVPPIYEPDIGSVILARMV